MGLGRVTAAALDIAVRAREAADEDEAYARNAAQDPGLRAKIRGWADDLRADRDPCGALEEMLEVLGDPACEHCDWRAGHDGDCPRSPFRAGQRPR